MRFNNDTAANYDYQILQGSSSGVVASESFAQTLMLAGPMPANTAGANLFAASIAFIPNYAGASNNKIALSICANKVGTSSGNMANHLVAAFWRSSAAINRITLLPLAGNFVAGTRVTIYGMGA